MEKKMKLRFLLPGMLALVLLVAACTPPNLRNEKFLHDDALFTADETCAAYCWHGITVGETNWADALTIIEDTPNFEKTQTQNEENDGPGIGIVWKEKEGDECCQMVTTDGKIVTTIFLQLAPNHNLKELIDVRGEPQYAIGIPGNDDQALVSLYYPNQGILAFAFVAGAAQGKLSDTSEIVAAYILAPDIMETALTQSNLYSWKGYDTFAAYAPDAENADFVITAVPTGAAGEATAEATDET
jgi:hypothetical protein